MNYCCIVVVYFGDARTWLRRSDDGSFSSWWDGLYVLNEKIADYIVAKTEGGWTGNSGKHSRNGFEYGKIRENISVNPYSAIIKIEGARVECWEVGIDIRHVYGNGSAAVKTRGNTVVAEGKRRIEVTFNARIVGIREREHSPLDRDIPRKTKIYVVTLEGKNPLKIQISRVPKREVERVQERNTALTTNSPLDDVYSAARATLRKLLAREGFYAGLPWFTQYWSRDTLWSLPAIIREGFSKEAREMLLTFAYNMEEGEIPRLVREDGTAEYGSIDANPLFIHAAYTYAKKVDSGIIDLLRRKLLEAWDFLYTILENGLIVSRGKDTWMDTMDGKRYPIDVIALWYRAARDMEALGLGKSLSDEIKRMFDENKLKYTIEKSANIFVAAICGLITPKEALKRAKMWRLLTEWGVRTLSPLEIEYEPTGYHTGCAWGLTTGWGMYVAALAGDWDTFWALVKALKKRGNYLDECWDCNTGKKLGADIQLWSAALPIRTIDEVLVDLRRIPGGVDKIIRVRWGRWGIERKSITRHG